MWDDISSWFWFVFPWLVMLSIFLCKLLAICMLSLEKCLQFFCPFLNQIVFWVLSWINSLYSLDSNPLSDVSFANIFSHSVGCLFVLLMASFAVKNLFSLVWTHLFVFASVDFAWEDKSSKKLLRLISKSVLLVFFYKFYGFRSYI